MYFPEVPTKGWNLVTVWPGLGKVSAQKLIAVAKSYGFLIVQTFIAGGRFSLNGLANMKVVLQREMRCYQEKKLRCWVHGSNR